MRSHRLGFLAPLATIIRFFFPSGLWGLCGVESMRFSAVSRRSIVSRSLYWSESVLRDITGGPNGMDQCD